MGSETACIIRGLELVQGLDGSGQSRLRSTAPILLTLAEDRQQAVSHVLEHLAAFRLDRGHKAVEKAIQELDGPLRRQGGGDPGVVPHVGEQDGRADSADLTPPDGAGQDGPVWLIADVDPKDIIEVMIADADLHHGRNRRHHKPQNPQALLAKSVRGAGREGQAVLGAVGEEDRDNKIVPVPRRLQVRDDVEPIVRGLREVEEQPVPGAVNMGERALVVDHRSPLGPCGKKREVVPSSLVQMRPTPEYSECRRSIADMIRSIGMPKGVQALSEPG